MISKCMMRMLVVAGVAVGVSGVVRAEKMDGVDRSMRQLGRGIANVVSSPFEIPGTIYDVKQTDGDMAAATYGTLRGTSRALTRIGVGVFEIATFPMGLKPIVEPEFTLQGGPVNDIFNPADRNCVTPSNQWDVNRVEKAKPVKER